MLCLALDMAKAGDTIVINDSQDEYVVRGKAFDILEDPSALLGIEEVAKERSDFFHINEGDVPTNTNKGSAYWIRFEVIDLRKDKAPLTLDIFDFRIDQYNLYFEDADGRFKEISGGDLQPFSNKNFQHKNFVQFLPHIGDQSRTFYLRIKSEQPVGILGKIRTVPELLYYSNNEYFFLALFYGVVLSMLLYNLFLFFSTRDRAYVFYVAYVACVGLYALTQDGLGFQYLWSSYPQLNGNIFPVVLCLMVIAVMLYARSFLNTKNSLPFFDKGILVIIAVRILILIVGFVFYRPLHDWPQVDFFPFLFIFIAGLYAYYRGFIAARFYLIAFTFLFIGFFISGLALLQIIDSNIYTVYGFNIGVVWQMIFLALALADRIKFLIKENEAIQKEVIYQLEEKKGLKDQLNKKLERMVLERTQELEEKNFQLDTFVHRASHDIKAPLRSIIGLASLGIKDVTDPLGRQYLEHVLTSTKRLDTILVDMLNLTKIKNLKPEKIPVKLHDIFYEVLNSFKHDPEYERVRFEVDIVQEVQFNSDPKILTSILQNLIENSIKYHDQSKNESWVKVYIRTSLSGAILRFEDNGLGIPDEMRERIFEMFFKVNEESRGTGLGLYLVKMAVEKLDGTINLKSTPGEGSTFQIKIPSENN